MERYQILLFPGKRADGLNGQTIFSGRLKIEFLSVLSVSVVNPEFYCENSMPRSSPKPPVP
jgi:hypothetical protein